MRLHSVYIFMMFLATVVTVCAFVADVVQPIPAAINPVVQALTKK